MSTVEKVSVDVIRDQQAEEALKCYDEYLRLVLDVANNEDVDPTSTRSVLAMAGKSFDDLDADVERMRKRLESFRQLESKPEIEQQLSEAKAFHADLQKRYEEVCKPIIEKMAPAFERIRWFEAKLLDLSFHEDHFSSTAWHDIHDHRLSELEKELKQLAIERRKSEMEIERRTNLRSTDTPEHGWELQRFERLEKRRIELNAEIDRLRKLRLELPK